MNWRQPFPRTKLSLKSDNILVYYRLLIHTAWRLWLKWRCLLKTGVLRILSKLIIHIWILLWHLIWWHIWKLLIHLRHSVLIWHLSLSIDHYLLLHLELHIGLSVELGLRSSWIENWLVHSMRLGVVILSCHVLNCVCLEILEDWTLVLSLLSFLCL